MFWQENGPFLLPKRPIQEPRFQKCRLCNNELLFSSILGIAYCPVCGTVDRKALSYLARPRSDYDETES